MPAETTIEMRRCGTSGSVFTCGCTPRFTDLDVGPDYSCLNEKVVTYVEVDGVRDVLDRAFHPQNPSSDHPVDVFDRYIAREVA